MISKSLPWNEVRLEGNPKRSSKVNDVIKQVKMREAAGAKQGALSKKRRTMETAELAEEMIGMIEEMVGACIIASFASAYFHYQFNMIARLDDTAKLRRDSTTFERCSICAAYAINTQLCWSKNVRSEEDAPPQEICLMGAAEARFCALMGLALWMEVSLAKGNMHSTFLVFEIGDLEDPPTRIKLRASDTLSEVIRSDDYADWVIDFSSMVPLGLHSIHKYGMTLSEGRCRWSCMLAEM